jgi:hypothetical protein
MPDRISVDFGSLNKDKFVGTGTRGRSRTYGKPQILQPAGEAIDASKSVLRLRCGLSTFRLAETGLLEPLRKIIFPTLTSSFSITRTD